METESLIRIEIHARAKHTEKDRHAEAKITFYVGRLGQQDLTIACPGGSQPGPTHQQQFAFGVGQAVERELRKVIRQFAEKGA